MTGRETPADPSPVLRCFNAKFSPNLGDGLLSECLERALVERGAHPSTSSIDLAARERYGDAMMGRDTIMRALEAMPGPLRRMAVRAPLKINAVRKWGPHYARGLEGAEGVVIGGGNLLADLDLNFPTKLSLAVEEADRRNLPTAIYACGMSDGWSRTGLAMARKAFARPSVRAVFLRDEASKRLWDELMAPYVGHGAHIVRDPGLLACDHYTRAERPGRDRPIAGLGLMSHTAIRYHSSNVPTLERLESWYVDLARELIARGFHVRAFTNGSPEDKAFAHSMHDRLRSLGEDADLSFPTQRDPAGLCQLISGLDVLIAYRMHAVIAAYSFGVPPIALAWDRKLRSFMESVGRADSVRDVATTAADECADLARTLADVGLPESERTQVVAEARDDVGKLWRVFAEGA